MASERFALPAFAAVAGAGVFGETAAGPSSPVQPSGGGVAVSAPTIEAPFVPQQSGDGNTGRDNAPPRRTRTPTPTCKMRAHPVEDRERMYCPPDGPCAVDYELTGRPDFSQLARARRVTGSPGWREANAAPLTRAKTPNTSPMPNSSQVKNPLADAENIRKHTPDQRRVRPWEDDNASATATEVPTPP